MIFSTRHTGLVATNILASIYFYESSGLRVWKREMDIDDFISQVVGLDNVEIEPAKLKLSNGSLLELLEYRSRPTNTATSIYKSNMQKGLHVVNTGRESFKIGPPHNMTDAALLEGVAVLGEAIAKVALI